MESILWLVSWPSHLKRFLDLSVNSWHFPCGDKRLRAGSRETAALSCGGSSRRRTPTSSWPWTSPAPAPKQSQIRAREPWACTKKAFVGARSRLFRSLLLSMTICTSFAAFLKIDKTCTPLDQLLHLSKFKVSGISPWNWQISLKNNSWIHVYICYASL